MQIMDRVRVNHPVIILQHVPLRLAAGRDGVGIKALVRVYLILVEVHFHRLRLILRLLVMGHVLQGNTGMDQHV